MIIAKFSRTTENLTSKKTQLMSWDVQTDSNPPAKVPPLLDVMAELSSDLDGVQEEMAESSYTKESKINLNQQLQQVLLQKK